MIHPTVGFFLLVVVDAHLDIRVAPFVHTQTSPALNCPTANVPFLHEPLLTPLAGLNALGHDLYIKSQNQNVWDAANDTMSCAVKISKESDKSPLEGFCECTAKMRAVDTCREYSDLFSKSLCFTQYATNSTCTPAEPFSFSQKCQATLSGDISSLDLTLQDLTYKTTLPSVIPHSLVFSEGRTYYFLWRALENFKRQFDDCFACGSTFVPTPLIPSWTPVLTLHTKLPTPLPLVQVSQHDSNNFLIVVRSAATTSEGYLSASTQSAFEHLANFPGTVMEGPSSISRAVLPAIEYFFSRFIESTIAPAPSGNFASSLIHPRIIVAGHGTVSGPVAAYIAAELQLVLNDPKLSIFPKNFVPTEPNKFRVDLVTFNAGVVGDGTFVANIARTVNARTIEVDLATNFPCGTVPTCTEVESQVATSLVLGKFASYARLPGKIEITNKELAELHPNSIWDTDGAKYQLGAQAVCAVSCWLSEKFCDDEVATMCDRSTCSAMFETN